jgi:hypothetical protein
MNTTNTNEQILAEFNAFFAQASKEVSTIVDNAINLEAIEVLKSKTATLKQYIIEDVTPLGYGI